MSETEHAWKHGGDGREPITAAAVAALVGGRLIGDPEILVQGIAPLDRAMPSDVSFLSHQRYVPWFATTKAGVVLVDPAFESAAGGEGARIVVDKPTDAMVSLLARFHRPEPRRAGIHATAVIGERVRFGEGVTVEAYAVIGDDVAIGDRGWIGAHASIGSGTSVGADARIHAGATLYRAVEVGDRAVIHSGARVGREGFGFVPGEKGAQRIPHVGRCVIEHDVEIGANCCIDRGSVDDTVIGAGTKIDNLVHIAHNVRIGRGCFLAAQVGVAGSTRIGDGVQMGGQVGIAGHVNIGARASLAGQAGVIGDVPPSETWSGYPARPHKEQLRAAAALSRLARLVKPIERLLGGSS